MLKKYKELGREYQFAILVRYSIDKYFSIIEEQKQQIRKNGEYPVIHGDEDIIKEIAIYVANNLKEYITIHKVKINSFDEYKVLYWVGMYFYENDYIEGVSKIQSIMNDNLDKEKQINNIEMFNKIDTLSKTSRDDFFKYYGRFGLYHAFKLYQNRILSMLSPIEL